jgi:DNA/RNA endonuclease G (NUC1)
VASGETPESAALSPAATHSPASPSSHPDVFLSYSRGDQSIAGALRELLESEGWDVWWDEEIYAGATWEELLLGELAQCKAVVVLWSQRAAAKSDWVLREAEVAQSLGKLVPCIIDDVAPPAMFGPKQYAQLEGWSGGTEHPGLPRLFAGLEHLAAPSRIVLVRPGFDVDFLNFEIGLPSIPGVGDEFPYLHFSVVMNPARRLAWYVAYGIEPQSFVPERPSRWSPDPTLSRLFQPTNEHFLGTGFDRGHLVAPNSVGWGEERPATIALRQSYYWTNTSPQAPEVNQRTWYSLENLERSLAARSGRVVGFSGPVLDRDDPLHVVTDELRGRLHARQTFRLPRRYWKVVVWPDGGRLESACFEVPNARDLAPSASPKRLSVGEVEEMTGLEFPDQVRAAIPATSLPT